MDVSQITRLESSRLLLRTRSHRYSHPLSNVFHRYTLPSLIPYSMFTAISVLVGLLCLLTRHSLLSGYVPPHCSDINSAFSFGRCLFFVIFFFILLTKVQIVSVELSWSVFQKCYRPLDFHESSHLSQAGAQSWEQFDKRRGRSLLLCVLGHARL